MCSWMASGNGCNIVVCHCSADWSTYCSSPSYIYDSGLARSSLIHWNHSFLLILQHCPNPKASSIWGYCRGASHFRVLRLPSGTLDYGSSLRPQSCIHWVSGNAGLSCLVGLLGLVVTLIGSDSACHLSGELKDTAWVKWVKNCDSPGKLFAGFRYDNYIHVYNPET